MQDNTYIQICPTCKIYSNGTAQDPVYIIANENYWGNIVIEAYPRFFFDGSESTQPGSVEMIEYSNGQSVPSLYFTDIQDILDHPSMQKAIFQYTIFDGYGVRSGYNIAPMEGGVYKNCKFQNALLNSAMPNGFYAEKCVFDNLTNFEYYTTSLSSLVTGNNGFSVNNNITNIISGTYSFPNSGMININTDYNLENYPMPMRKGVFGTNLYGLLNGYTTPTEYSKIYGTTTVSYTHLTLPTNREV